MRTQWDWQWCLELKSRLSYQALTQHQNGLYSTYRKDAHTLESLGVGMMVWPQVTHGTGKIEGEQVPWPQLPTAQLLLMPPQGYDQQNQLGTGGRAETETLGSQ